MADLKFKAGDPLNPYDPASFSLGEQGVYDRIKAGQSPLSNPALLAKLSDPAYMAKLKDMLQADAEERQRTGESMVDQMMREKKEWAALDARSAALKVEGNAAFAQGDYKRAYLVYSACARLSPHEPVYKLNRSAAALRLKVFVQAEQDADSALEGGSAAKAYFRRGQARRCVGKIGEAAKDLLTALELQPGDAGIKAELAEVDRLGKLSAAELENWVKEQGATTLQEIYGSTEAMEALIEEIKA
ncbi:TPR-like protein [Lyophyllum atratum]|nr:TPR-like protein [Lyophyllum atratum]